MNRRAARANRTGLVIVGLILLAAGGAALARSLGAFGSRLAGEPLLTRGIRDFPAGRWWFWPAVAAVSVLIALLAVGWLLAQGRSDRLSRLRVESESSAGGTRVAANAVTGTLESDIEALPGVRRVRARLLGSDEHPRLGLTVSYAERADPASLRDHIADRSMPRMRTALELESLPAVVRLRLVPGEPRRTVV